MSAVLLTDDPVAMPATTRAHVTVRGLCKSFAGKPLYTDFNLDLPRSKIVSIFGPNGCGKSTLMNMIAGLIPLDKGEILFDGKTLKETKIGYVFQNYRDALFPWITARDNIAYPLRRHGMKEAEVQARVDELVNLFEIRFDLARYPLRTVRRPTANRVHHARAGPQPRGHVPRRALLCAGLRDDPVHPRKAARGPPGHRRDHGHRLA